MGKDDIIKELKSKLENTLKEIKDLKAIQCMSCEATIPYIERLVYCRECVI